MFKIMMGVPEMRDSWNDLKSRIRGGDASKDEKKLFSQDILDIRAK